MNDRFHAWLILLSFSSILVTITTSTEGSPLIMGNMFGSSYKNKNFCQLVHNVVVSQLTHTHIRTHTTNTLQADFIVLHTQVSLYRVTSRFKIFSTTL